MYSVQTVPLIGNFTIAQCVAYMYMYMYMYIVPCMLHMYMYFCCNACALCGNMYPSMYTQSDKYALVKLPLDRTVHIHVPCTCVIPGAHVLLAIHMYM